MKRLHWQTAPLSEDPDSSGSDAVVPAKWSCALSAAPVLRQHCGSSDEDVAVPATWDGCGDAGDCATWDACGDAGDCDDNNGPQNSEDEGDVVSRPKSWKPRCPSTMRLDFGRSMLAAHEQCNIRETVYSRNAKDENRVKALIAKGSHSLM